MTKKYLALLLAILVILPLMPVYADKFVDNENWTEISANQVAELRASNSDGFIIMYYRQTCSVSESRKIVFDDWMTRYGIKMYGVDIDKYSLTASQMGVDSSILLPVIHVVKNQNESAIFTGDDSIRSVREAVNDLLGINAAGAVDFYEANSLTTATYKNEAKYLKPVGDIDRRIVSEANEIIQDAKTDYEKLQKIHDWVALFIHYDWVIFDQGGDNSALATYRRYSAVCEGFANLTSELCHAAGIPNRLVYGFATGVGYDEDTNTVWGIYNDFLADGNLEKLKTAIEPLSNHVWNEAFVDGRWVILDTTWDSSSADYALGAIYGSMDVEQTYFDPDLTEFSATHLITGIVSNGENMPNDADSEALTAEPTASTVLVNGRAIEFDAYFIEGSNYFKLRELAYVLFGTEKQFDVGWDGDANAISLTSGVQYSIVGGERISKGGGVKTPVLTDSPIFLNGEKVHFTAYNIDGNNYFKLRDLAAAFNFFVGWDEERYTITIDTGAEYFEEEKQ